MRKFPFLHLILFILTFLSTLTAGALFQKGIDIFNEPWRIYEGLPFSVAIMVILLGHELSHFFASKIHNTKATLPYFIPAPSLIGTFGAFIKMKSPIETKRALVDIGASGPIAGFILSVIATIIGLSYSNVVPAAAAKSSLGLGDSILFSLLSRLILGAPPDSYDILLHPVAFAGWIGLFVTSLNLIPIGQLDGGHIAFAFLGRWHRMVSICLVAVLITLGLFSWEGWTFWGVLMVILGIKHPPVLYEDMEIGRKRKIVGALSFIIFIITFIPSPFRIM